MAKNAPQLRSPIRKVRGLHSGTDHINLSYQSKFTFMKNALRSFIYTENVWYQWRKKPRKKQTNKKNQCMYKNGYLHIWTTNQFNYILKQDESIQLWFCCRFWASVTDTLANLDSHVHVCVCVSGAKLPFRWLSPSQADELGQRVFLLVQPKEPRSEVRRGCWATRPSLQSALMPLDFKRVQVRGFCGGTNSNWRRGETSHKTHRG